MRIVRQIGYHTIDARSFHVCQLFPTFVDFNYNLLHTLYSDCIGVMIVAKCVEVIECVSLSIYIGTKIT